MNSRLKSRLLKNTLEVNYVSYQSKSKRSVAKVMLLFKLGTVRGDLAMGVIICAGLQFIDLLQLMIRHKMEKHCAFFYVCGRGRRG